MPHTPSFSPTQSIRSFTRPGRATQSSFFLTTLATLFLILGSECAADALPDAQLEDLPGEVQQKHDQISFFYGMPLPHQNISEASAPTLPQEPEPVVPSDAQILVPEMKGLLILGSPEKASYLVRENLTGVVLRGVSPPGSSVAFTQRLTPFIVGKPLTQRVLSQLKRQIILYYREHDRPIVLVLVPEQDVSDGVLQLVVVEGRVGTVNISGQKHFREQDIRKQIHLKSGDLIDSDLLLTDVAWLNQNPFRQTNVVFAPGEKNGTTNVDLVTRDRFPFRFYAGADNTGNPLTGMGRWFTGFNWGNAFNLGHLFSFQWTTAANPHRFMAYTGSYSIPLPWRDTLTFFGGYSEVHPDIPRFRSEGRSAQVSLRYKIDLGKTYGNLQQNLQYGYDFKQTNSNLFFADDKSTAIHTKTVQLGQFVLSYHVNYLPQYHVINGDVNFFFSPAAGIFEHQTRESYNTLQPGATPIYYYTQFFISDDFALSRGGWKLFLAARGQISGQTLLPSEQFGLGGYSTVRGYLERVVNDDNALCINLELKTPPFALWKMMTGKTIHDTLYLLAFLDYGYGTPHQQEKGTNRFLDDGSRMLLGVGPGLRYKIVPYFTARLDIGFPLTDVPGNGTHPRVHFGVIFSY